ncbi:GNAT family N-acetyltransferase [Hyalangium versicolor]|uniref:GNAT family N-acetyltransferase n=1 Tax=Hyalangium versicolor TaxID=2861190 RepID=UPI001CC9889C|nr:GNAT family N-acetyltransferase [Hyalangium versicolor]
METGKPEFGPPDGADELAAAADIIAQSFAMTPADGGSWVEKARATNLRVLREQGSVTATALPIPMGQFFCGRRVTMAGIGGVGVAPSARGQGAATRLMRHTLQELRTQGFALSVLYPATQPLYRRVGFEQAGSRYEIRVQAHGLDFSERSLQLRPVKDSDLPVIQELYRRSAASRQGYLDRGPYVWDRVFNPRNETAYGFLVEGANGVEGYLYLVRRRKVDILQEIALTDFVALTPAAGRRLLSFLGDHRSLAREVVWTGSQMDPLLLLLPEQTYQVKLLFHWMLRVLDVPAALESRGYPPGVSGTLHFELEDELFPENRGNYILEVSGGAGHVRRGGNSLMHMDIRAFASLYTGFLSPDALRSVGALVADDASVRLATTFFSGPAPALPDMF